MGYHVGTVAAKNLFATIIAKITQTQAEASSPYWVKESSQDADGVYTSAGTSGSERIVVIMKENTIGQGLMVGYAKDYTPGAVNTAGTFVQMQQQSLNYYSSVQHEDTLVTYHLSVTAERIIIHLQGDKLITQWQNPVVFLGMPIRYDSTDKLCIVKASSENSANSGTCRVIESSTGVNHQDYTWYYVASPGSPSWGNKYFIETFHFGLGAEGLRGEIDGLYGSHDAGLVDGDQVDINGVKYLVIARRAVGVNSFPRNYLLMKMA